ncbi:ABC transporter permease [Paenibacillus lemnae]|uniref:ABC transporter permease n=1 Tax=Paenibacillus lemnae TaxID=1330551 RepID=A0A848MBH5_PAELE|nr:ABC transporter permease [Paenibacillus lemnae]NMO97363.1 ABC transporter permease [Paenibacillus lemnae]
MQKNRSLFVLFGGMISTMLIVSALQLQFSMNRSGQDYMQQNYGAVVGEISSQRERVTEFNGDAINQLYRDMSTDGYYDGMLPAVMGRLTVFKPDHTGAPDDIQSGVMLFAFPKDLYPEHMDAAGGEAKSYIRQAASLVPPVNEVWLDSRTANALKASAGDQVSIVHEGEPVSLTVGQVVDASGLLLYPGAERTALSMAVHPDTAASLLGIKSGSANRVLLLSNDLRTYAPIQGGWSPVFTANEASHELEKSTKLLPIFTIASLTSIVIGMLFMINLFHMITEERRQEIGILRAIGLNASQTRGLLLLEGFWYAVFSGMIGLAAGAGLSVLLVHRLGDGLGLLLQTENGSVLSFQPHLDLLSFTAAFGIGLLLTMLSVAVVSGSPLRKSIVEALKPAAANPDIAGRRSSAMKLIGGIMTCAVLIGSVSYSFTDHFLTCVSFPEIDLFGILLFCFFILLLAAITSILLLPVLLKLLYSLLAPLSRWRGMLMISLRYPLYYSRRSVLQLLMFAGVLFLTCFAAVFGENAAGHFEDFDSRRATGGFERYAAVDWNLSEKQLEEKIYKSPSGTVEHIRSAVIERKKLDFGYNLSVFGVTPKYGELQELNIVERAPGFASDSEAWRSLAENPDLIIVSDNFLGAVGQPERAAGDRLIFRERGYPGRGDGALFQIDKKIAAIVKVPANALNIAAAQGVWMSQESFAEDVTNGPVSSLLLFKGIADQEVREQEWQVLEESLTAMNIYPLLDPEQMNEEGTGFLRIFFGLFEGFSALAALIGTTGLVLLTLRSFAERKQQFGMLRAIGVKGSHIRMGFSLESGVIAILGITIGVLAGTYGGYLMIQAFMQDGKEAFSREVVNYPWIKLAAYYGGAILLTYLCVAIPARKVQQLPPAEAFRYLE